MKTSMDSETVEAQAAGWFARKHGDHWSDADERALDEWLNAKTAHRVAYIRLNAGWQHNARLRALGAGIPKGTIPPRGAWTFSPFFDQNDGAGETQRVSGPALQDRNPRSRNARSWKIAAGLLIVLMGGASGFYFSQNANAYHTAVGHTDTIPLRDGSTVTLNTDSKIRVDLNESERRISLDRGEAFFDVAKDEQRPFTVVAGARRIVAVGTKFSVRRDRDDVVVVVTEGRVRLEGTAENEQLDAGSVAQTRKSAISVQKKQAPEVEQMLSWRSGYVTFRETDLVAAVAEFNRYSEQKIRIRDRGIEHIRIGGNFRTDDAETFLWLLENGFPVRVEQLGNEVVLTQR